MYYNKNERLKRNILFISVFSVILIFVGYKIYDSTRDKTQYIIKGNGRIEGNEIVIATKFSGRIVELKVDEGDVVKKGDLLAVLDARVMTAEIDSQKAKLNEISKQINSTEANIKSIMSDIRFYSKEVSRTKTLIKQSFSSQLELDKNINNLEKAEAQLASLEAERNALKSSYEALEFSIKAQEINKDEMNIIAPTDGVILYRLVEDGEVLDANGKLFVMYNPDNLYMTIYMPSKLAGQVKLGETAYIKLDAYSSTVFPSRVTFVAENAEFTPKEVETQEEREKLVFRVKLTLDDNSERKAKPGMPGDGYIKIDEEKDWPTSIVE